MKGWQNGIGFFQRVLHTLTELIRSNTSPTNQPDVKTHQSEQNLFCVLTCRISRIPDIAN